MASCLLSSPRIHSPPDSLMRRTSITKVSGNRVFQQAAKGPVQNHSGAGITHGARYALRGPNTQSIRFGLRFSRFSPHLPPTRPTSQAEATSAVEDSQSTGVV